MAVLVSSLCPRTSFLFSQPKRQHGLGNHVLKFQAITSGLPSSSSSSTDHGKLTNDAVSEALKKERTASGFGFEHLSETFWVDVHRAEKRPLRVPFGCSKEMENVAIRVELGNGCVGWGEAVVASEDDSAAMTAMAKEACEFLQRSSPATLSSVFEEVAKILHGQEFASVRAGVEMALIDAVASSIDVPLWRLFGGVSNTLTTSITIPITSPAEASSLASKHCAKGFNTIRFNLGLNLSAELEVIKAVHVAQPQCSLILDANGKYTSEEAISVLEKMHDMAISPLLFEQPVHRDDWNGLAKVSRVAGEVYGLKVSADESCRTLSDVRRVLRDGIAEAINVKLEKFGVLGTLRIVEIARNSGVSLAIDSAVQTRLATGFAGHLACGLGCFKYVNLDAPFMLSDDPVFGGYEVSGPVYKFTNARGLGGFLKQNLVYQ